MIYSTSWGLEEKYSNGSLRTYILSLRKLLGKDSIINIKGIGYKLVV